VRKLGSFGDLLKKIPGLNKMMPQGFDGAEDEIKYTEAIILSMTPKERKNPGIINGNRRRRIARGSGTTVQDVNALLKDFQKMRDMVKQMMRGAKGGKGRRMRGPIPPMPGF
ncbi:MAG: signal recognition particle protein, partial [Candidatus Hydrogenedens sp.]|nr:signal recognition particle protein [Candidatus Hydrogenedens sp.]